MDGVGVQKDQARVTALRRVNAIAGVLAALCLLVFDYMLPLWASAAFSVWRWCQLGGMSLVGTSQAGKYALLSLEVSSLHSWLGWDVARPMPHRSHVDQAIGKCRSFAELFDCYFDLGSLVFFAVVLSLPYFTDHPAPLPPILATCLHVLYWVLLARLVAIVAFKLCIRLGWAK